MKSTAWLMIYSTANSALGYPLQQNQGSVFPHPRDLLGLLEGDEAVTTPSQTQVTYSPNSASSSVASKPALDVEPPGSTPPIHHGKGPVFKTFTATTHPTPALQAMMPTSVKETTLTDVVYSTRPYFVPEPSPSSAATTITAGEYIAQTPGDTPPAELTEWKVIGVAVISVTLIAIIILSVTFFDSWWGFLRAVVLGKNKGGNETLLPDPEQRSWEFKLASEDGHRYPTMESLESIAKEKDRQADRRLICDGQAPSSRQSNL
ncbi:hypothetical protein BJ165DRAFT_1521824 [Panaeolus papilionaceus]|nr:hypothetical protein BJ165DRAFT_1521824 [Panaeolus papilionaceus]